MLITSRQNSKVKELVGLRERKQRQAAGVVLIDGFAELQLALEANVALKSLFYCPELMGGDEQQAELKKHLASGTEAYELTREVFEKVSYREGPDGWLAVAAPIETSLGKLKLLSNPLILVCEGVEKPGNFGAMLRTADAAGVSAVIAIDASTDWGNPNVIRASKGAVFSVPVASASQTEARDWLRAKHAKILAATPEATAVYSTVDMTGPTAILVGAENQGLSQFWLDAADERVTIPMSGRVDSLNVATSAAIMLYEAVRQRGSV